VRTVTLADVTVAAPEPGPADWNDEGVLFLPRFFHEDLVEPYREEWWALNGSGDDPVAVLDRSQPFVLDSPRRGGWGYDVPYMHHPALRRIVCDPVLAERLHLLVGEPMGVHLNLTGWVTTERDWHQDSYLNPDHVGDYYAAIWFSLGEVHPDSGPFQYVPGSHRWPQVTRDLIGPHVNLGDPMWPKHSERILSPLFEDEISAREASVVTYTPSYGDVLVWHGRLLHRGSRARVEGTYRPSLIAHYSGIGHRPDMPHSPVQDPAGGWYFPIEQTPR